MKNIIIVWLLITSISYGYGVSMAGVFEALIMLVCIGLLLLGLMITLFKPVREHENQKVFKHIVSFK